MTSLVCYTDGGAELFALGSLSGLGVRCINSLGQYFHGRGSDIVSTETDHAKQLAWGVFGGRISLCAVDDAQSCDGDSLNAFLGTIFNAMRLNLSEEELQLPVSSLRRKLLTCLGVVNFLLNDDFLIGPRLGRLDCAMVEDLPGVQHALNDAAYDAGSDYAFVSVGGCVVAATSRFWQLTASEKMLLGAYARSLPQHTGFESPVYLFQTSPKVPFRFLSICLTGKVNLCLLCGPSPSMTEAQDIARDIFKSVVKSLQAPEPSVDLGEGVLGTLVCESRFHRCFFVPAQRPSTTPEADEQRISFVGLCQAAKRSYRQWQLAVGRTNGHVSPADIDEPTDFYLHTKAYKVYAFEKKHLQVLTMMDPMTPSFALRKLATQALDAIQDRLFL